VGAALSEEAALEIVIRAAFVYFFLWFLLRAMGKRELAEVTAFELVILVVLGDLVQNGVTQEDMSVTGSALAVTTMALLAVATSTLGFRSSRAERLLDGRPSVVVRHGEVIEEVLRLQRITRDELAEQARKKGITDLREVEWAIVESDGSFTFIGPDAG
jgi:uncharacterized membrane protein YcaP (DUF421 family)